MPLLVGERPDGLMAWKPPELSESIPGNALTSGPGSLRRGRAVRWSALEVAGRDSYRYAHDSPNAATLEIVGNEPSGTSERLRITRQVHRTERLLRPDKRCSWSARTR